MTVIPILDEVIVTEELLYCESDGGGGDSCGGGEDPDTTVQAYCKKGKLALSCPYAERGSEVMCSVKNVGTQNLNLNDFNYAWSVPDGIRGPSGKGEDYASWGGIATTPRTVRVVVTGPSETVLLDTKERVDVKARMVGSAGWEFEAMTHPPYTYGIAKNQGEGAWGAYEPWIADRGYVGEGSGPWEGEYYTVSPFQLEGRMYLHPDFDTSGKKEGLAHKTCSGVPSEANVLTVNTICGYRKALKEVWEPRAAAHEQAHEDGANLCLQSGSAARNVLAEMEKITRSDRLDVRSAFDLEFNKFLEGAFRDAIETATSTPTSPVIWEHRDNGAWTLQALRPAKHNGKNGC